MKGDFSRLTFYPKRSFSRVLLQQGRVQLDADWNEQASILLHATRDLARDLIGPWGGPADLFWTNDPALPPGRVERRFGFEVQVAGEQASQMTIGPGRYYVDGLLVQNDRWYTYPLQPYYAVPAEADLSHSPFLVYLDVWERFESYIEQPSIREVALGGPDTAARAQVVWQVKAWPPDNRPDAKLGNTPLTDLTNDSVHEVWPDFLAEIHAGQSGCMSAWTVPDDLDPTQPCITPPTAGYRGLENQLYRVEVHRSGKAWDKDKTVARSDAATFKWSRDNGCVAAEWLGTDGTDLSIRGVRDDNRGFAAGQWVELMYDALELNAQPGVLLKLAQAAGDVLTIDKADAGSAGWSSKYGHSLVRRWDQVKIEPEGSSPPHFEPDGSILVEEDLDIPLEQGITIRFQTGSTTPSYYRTGDYWLIAARTATRDVEWPRDDKAKPSALEPHGIRHHYAPLAVVKGIPEGAGESADIADLRCKMTLVVDCKDILNDPSK